VGLGRELGACTSSGFFCRMAARPEAPSVGAILLFEPARWPETCVRRFCAGIHGQSHFDLRYLLLLLPADMM
jgi:hypothetical protein